MFPTVVLYTPSIQTTHNNKIKPIFLDFPGYTDTLRVFWGTNQGLITETGVGSHTVTIESQTGSSPYIRRKMFKVGTTFLWRTAGRLLLLILWIEAIKLSLWEAAVFVCLIHPPLIWSCFNPLTSGVPATVCDRMTKCSLSASFSCKGVSITRDRQHTTTQDTLHHGCDNTTHSNRWYLNILNKYWIIKEMLQ